MLGAVTSTPPERQRPLQAERLNLSITTVVAIGAALIAALSTAIGSAAVASNRQANAEARIEALERKVAESEQLRFTVRDLQNGLADHGRRLDDHAGRIEGTSNLTMQMCVNVARYSAGVKCSVASK